jgi:hypothetical protein
MSAVETETIEESETDRVERWRANELERAGFEPDTAHILALRPDVDLHVAVGLIERGCAPALAAEILL